MSKSASNRVNKERKRLETVQKEFYDFYAPMYGKKRWSTLLVALQQPNRYCALVNKYHEASSPVFGRDLTTESVSQMRHLTCLVPVPTTGQAGKTKTVMLFDPPSPNLKGILPYYLMDLSSCVSVEALDVQPHDSVLDVCAAPGGKSVAIAQCLDLSGGRLHVNDVSEQRLKRLTRVLFDYIPQKFESRITISRTDATRYHAFKTNVYDKVLCDAHCSTERHLLMKKEDFMEWKPSRSSGCARTQLLLLLNSIAAAKDETGVVVYSTCSLSQLENDQVVEKALKQSPYVCSVDNSEEASMQSPILGERTKYGWIVLPDVSEGWGVLYFARIRKHGLKQQQPDEEEHEEDD